MKKGKITFILGGARSGKSKFAQEIAKNQKKVVFIATGEALDLEMEKRIKRHKKERPKHWTICEEPVNIDICLQKYNNPENTVIIDCLTLWVSNLMMRKLIKRKIKSFINTLNSVKCNVVIISNEVGQGIVPDNFIAREYRDLLGELNCNVAKISDKVYYLVCGIPIKIK